MGKVAEIIAALKTTAAVVSQGRFWAAMGRALLSPALLVVVTAWLALSFPGDLAQLAKLGFGAAGIGVALIGMACTALLYPLLMRAWCPEAARAVAVAMQLDLPELPLPSVARFIGAWLAVVLTGLLLLVPALFLPPPFSWLTLLPAALVFGSYQMRCALCIHAGPRTIKTVVANTTLRRTLIWSPLCGLPMVLFSSAISAIKGPLLPPHFLSSTPAEKVIVAFGMAGGLALLIVVLVMWAALSMQALGAPAAPAPAPPAPAPAAPVPVVPAARLVASAPGPVAPPRRPIRARTWLLLLFAVLVTGAACAYAKRLDLLHQYLIASDLDYSAHAEFTQGKQRTEDFLLAMLEKSACAGDVERIGKMINVGLHPRRQTLGAALACAAEKGYVTTARYLIEKGADVNFRLREPLGSEALTPLTPLQLAAHSRKAEMVRLLLDSGANAALQFETENGAMVPGALHFAAMNKDGDMIRVLVTAGANPNAVAPRGALFLFMEAAVPPADAAGWEVLIGSAERAGLVIGARDADGGDLLHWAAGRGQFALIDVLLARGFDRLRPQRSGALPLMRLAAWYQDSKVEPGPELETALQALSSGVSDINLPVTVHELHPGGYSSTQHTWTIARVAAERPRVRALFGKRVDDSMLGW